jgi:hypothetical protein
VGVFGGVLGNHKFSLGHHLHFNRRG